MKIQIMPHFLAIKIRCLENAERFDAYSYLSSNLLPDSALGSNHRPNKDQKLNILSRQFDDQQVNTPVCQP